MAKDPSPCATGHQQTVSRETLINCAIEDIKTYSSAIGMARNQTDIDSYKRLRDSAEEALREAIAQPSETRQKLYPEMAKPSAASETEPPADLEQMAKQAFNDDEEWRVNLMWEDEDVRKFCARLVELARRSAIGTRMHEDDPR